MKNITISKGWIEKEEKPTVCNHNKDDLTVYFDHISYCKYCGAINDINMKDGGWILPTYFKKRGYSG